MSKRCLSRIEMTSVAVIQTMRNSYRMKLIVSRPKCQCSRMKCTMLSKEMKLREKTRLLVFLHRLQPPSGKKNRFTSVLLARTTKIIRIKTISHKGSHPRLTYPSKGKTMGNRQ